MYLGGFYDGSSCNISRTPYKLAESLLDYVDTFYDGERKIICYVHNLSYDMQFLLPYLRSVFGKEEKSIIIDSHKILCVDFKRIQFRCSYLLTGKSLDTLTNEYNVEHKKLTGTFDYNKIRYQDTILDKSELDYFRHDIIGLYEVLQILIKEKHGIQNLPLYSNGVCSEILLV